MRTLITATIFFMASSIFADQWTKLSTGATAHLHGVVSMNSKNAYAVGDGGAIVHTTDGGLSWITIHAGPPWSGIGGDTLHQVIGGNHDTIRYSAKGIWKTLQPIGAFNIAAVSPPLYFDSSYSGSRQYYHSSSAQIYLLVGELGNVEWVKFQHVLEKGEDHNNDLVTTMDTNTITYGVPDGGVNWVHKNLRASAALNPFFFAVGDSGMFLRSVDRGVSFVATTISASVNFNGIAVIRASRLLVIGDGGNIWMSDDNGSSWRNVSPSGLTERLNAVTFVDSLTGIIVGNNATILKTTDAGNSWVSQSSNTLANLNAVSCFNGEFGYGASWLIAGDSGTVLQCFVGGSPVDVMHTVDSISRAIGAVPINSKTTTAFTIQNNSSLSYLTARAVSLSPLFSVPGNLILDPQAAGKLSVVFTPIDTLPTVGTILLYTDEKWIPDTLYVNGYGTGAIAEIESDSMSISASQGVTKTLTIRNLGNGDLTSLVKFVSDSNIRVISDAKAAAHDSLHVSVQMKHTLHVDEDANIVIQLNDYRNPNTLDTIHITLIGEPAGVHDYETASAKTVQMYPNPIRRGNVLMIDGADQSRFNVRDALGNTVITTSSGLVATGALSSGVYWIGSKKFVVQ